MRKKIELGLITALTVALCANSWSLAASTGKVSMSPSKTDVTGGDEFSIVVSQETSGGIIGAEADLSYDTNLFELKSTEAATNWTDLGTETKVSIMQKDSVKETSGNLITLSFKVKDTEEKKTSNIKLSNIELYEDSSDKFSVEDQSVSIKVNGGSSENITNNTVENNNTNTSTNTNNVVSNTNTANTSTNTNNNGSSNTSNNKTNTTNTNTSKTNTNTNTNTNKTNSTSNTNKTNTDNSTSNTSSLPKTGSTPYILLVVVGLMGIAYISYRGYQKYKDI